MYTVYVLKNQVNTKLYVGLTQNLQRRLKEHNSGHSRFTSFYMPWEVIYTEEAADITAARSREKYLKSAAGKKYLRKVLPASSFTITA